MTNDLLFLVWLSDFLEFSILFEVVSTRAFSFSLLLISGLFFIYYRKTYLFLYIVLCIILGDQIGAFLKDFFQEPRPCFQYSVQLIDLGIIKNQCGERLTGMPSNHALNFFLFFDLNLSNNKKKNSRLLLIHNFFCSWSIKSFFSETFAKSSYNWRITRDFVGYSFL